MSDLATLHQQALASTSLADRVEAECLLEPQVDCPLVHHFGPGIYVREVFMPAGTLVVGHCHKLAHLNVFLSGSLALLDDAGGFKVLHAPFLFVSPPGRKMAWTITDCVWQNVVATEETDIDLGSIYASIANMKSGAPSHEAQTLLAALADIKISGTNSLPVGGGVLQPLWVLPNGEGFELIAGRRRYFAALQ